VTSPITLQKHANDPAAGWRATVEVPSGSDGTDEYGGYGPTPLEAVTDLAQSLANVIGYERTRKDA
jgi:hypothetical protein